jgi:hypothetical protein
MGVPAAMADYMTAVVNRMVPGFIPVQAAEVTHRAVVALILVTLGTLDVLRVTVNLGATAGAQRSQSRGSRQGAIR